MRDSKWSAAAAAAPVVLGSATLVAFWYAAERGIPFELAVAVLPAFLLEVTLYFLSASNRVRAGLERLRPALLAGLMTLAAPASYVLYSGRWDAVPFLVAMAAVASFWYVVLPKRSALVDAGFLIIMALPILLHVFKNLYVDPHPRLPADTLGVVMWWRTGLLAVLAIRKVEGVGFGLMPRRSEWVIGLREFAFLLPLVFGLGLAFGMVRLPERLDMRFGIILALTFAGSLWFLTVAEEFFFRGLLQQLLARITRSQYAGLILASAMFGLVHLGFRDFPNWRFVLLAAIAGFFFGRAYIAAGSIRAAMVAHACTVTLMKALLS